MSSTISTLASCRSPCLLCTTGASGSRREKRAMGVIIARDDRPEGGHLIRLTIDNAAKLNSLNRALMTELVDAVTALGADPRLRLVILTGAGERAFVGGADINELAQLDQQSAREFITLVHHCCDVFRR